MAEFSHPILTKGSPVEILPLNIVGQKAQAALMIDLKKRGIEDTELAGIELFTCVAFYTLKRVVPDLTQAVFEAECDNAVILALQPLIKAANSGPKANPPQASVA